MSVPLSAAVTLGLLLFFLSAGLNEQVAEGCTCLQRHPQRVFCESDIVIRAKVIGNVASTLPNLIAYNIKVITTYKPSIKKDIRVIYSTKICGAHLENGEYLLSVKQLSFSQTVISTDYILYWSILFDQEASKKVSDRSQKITQS
ncbi:hypothetical protein cypCar_00025022 [Cyprinus carpio]|nr:hypothetical protein cypCar_00025022 [Cyprinus carpio]